MNDSVYFRAWVANTVHAVSGIWPLDWQGLQRKCPLTFEEVRMAACQEGLLRKFAVNFQDSALVCERVTTNKRARSQKLH